MNGLFKKFIVIVYVLFHISAMAQETYDADGKLIKPKQNKKGFQVGLYTGAYFPNKATANAYDGYGFDIDGAKNSFETSFMYNKIIQEYGGYGNQGTPDQIAVALKVDYHTWTFDESNMPVNMRYVPAFLLGLHMNYSADNKNKILINVNAAKLTVSGNFTIITPLQANSTQINDRVKTFAIKGGEQRIMFQLGYQHLFGNDEKVNFLLEGGMNITLAKFQKNEILINDLYIDLTSSYYQPGALNTYVTLKPLGAGFGAFAGIGLNVNMSEKWIIQLLYNPTYEGIDIVQNARLKLQNSIGLRAYYKL